MVLGETELEMVLRHVRQGEEAVARQRELIAGLLASGHPTNQAEELLAVFEDNLRNHRAQLAPLLGAH